jgi:hypothetical protein
MVWGCAGRGANGNSGFMQRNHGGIGGEQHL